MYCLLPLEWSFHLPHLDLNLQKCIGYKSQKTIRSISVHFLFHFMPIALPTSMVLNICLFYLVYIILSWKAHNHSIQFLKRGKSHPWHSHSNSAIIILLIYYILVFIYIFNIAIITMYIKLCVLLLFPYVDWSL